MSETSKLRRKKRESHAPSSTSSSSCCSTIPRMKQAKAESVEDEKYQALRTRNNMAVRKSREKQRAKQAEVVKTLDMLRSENSELHSMVTARIRELKLLGSLLQQVNHPAPKRLVQILEADQLQHQEEVNDSHHHHHHPSPSNTEPNQTPSIPSSANNQNNNYYCYDPQQLQSHPISNHLPHTSNRNHLDDYSSS